MPGPIGVNDVKALLGRNNVDEFPTFRTQTAPALRQMLDQRVRLVLRQNTITAKSCDTGTRLTQSTPSGRWKAVHHAMEISRRQDRFRRHCL